MVVVAGSLSNHNLDSFVLKTIKYLNKNIYRKLLHLLPKYNNFVTVSNMGHYGRLGNQLFQYASSRSYSIKYDVPLLLPNPIEHRLGNFQISCKYVKRNTLKAVKSFHFEEKQYHFNPVFFQYHKRKNFTGYFQSEKYFYDIRDTLIREFNLKDAHKNDYCLQYIKKIRSDNPGKSIVALHNRRGDNIPSKNKFSDKEFGVFRPDKEAFHPLLSMDYINSAKSHFDAAVFLIFSDNEKDILWCKDHIKGKNHYYSEGHDDLTDFTLMHYCDHNIISNSSFSWWAAWLNENPDKKVIAPKKWFGDAYKDWDLKDLYPKDWIVI